MSLLLFQSQAHNHNDLHKPRSETFQESSQILPIPQLGMVDGMNIPILVDGAGAFSMGAAVAGAVARSPLYIPFEPSEFFIREVRCSSFELVQELICYCILPSSKVLQVPPQP